jgi:hypothetical protein
MSIILSNLQCGTHILKNEKMNIFGKNSSRMDSAQLITANNIHPIYITLQPVRQKFLKIHMAIDDCVAVLAKRKSLKTSIIKIIRRDRNRNRKKIDNIIKDKKKLKVKMGIILYNSNKRL